MVVVAAAVYLVASPRRGIDWKKFRIKTYIASKNIRSVVRITNGPATLGFDSKFGAHRYVGNCGVTPVIVVVVVVGIVVAAVTASVATLIKFILKMSKLNRFPFI